jgi:2-C-methyl-D-erythritol 2,4-cyclodiphosphate synthase
LRIGIGYDVHSLQTGRKLVLGGVHIPFDRGLLGHSDADVLLHAICDALLGAAALGDIGQHFPNTDPAYKNIFPATKIVLHMVFISHRLKLWPEPKCLPPDLQTLASH